MSSLIAYFDSTQALIATDTLATSINGEPSMFTTKAFIIPHLRMVIAGTGLSGFLGKWFTEINDRMVLNDIDNLDDHCQGILMELWEEWKSKFDIPNNYTTSVYHFGYSEEAKKIRVFSYKSNNNFASEEYKYSVSGFVVKPPVIVPSPHNLPDDFIVMMEAQRNEQSLIPLEQRVHIGGEIQVIHLLQGGYDIFILHRFDDYNQVKKAIFENYSKNNDVSL